MQITSDGKQRRSQNEWKRIVAEFERSGLSLREFAKQQSIPLASLQRWKLRLSRDSKDSETDFVDVTPSTSPSLQPQSWQAEIEFAGGVIVRLRG